jgi:hypothetical protein
LGLEVLVGLLLLQLILGKAQTVAVQFLIQLHLLVVVGAGVVIKMEEMVVLVVAAVKYLLVQQQLELATLLL